MKHGFANEVNNNIFSCPNNLKVSTYFKVSYGTPIKRKTLKMKETSIKIFQLERMFMKHYVPTYACL